MNETPEHHQVIVIGVGGIGSAAVYHLAKRGIDVLGIERFDIPHTHGSSHGETRIFRLSRIDDTEYVPLAKRAGQLWRQLEDESGREILTKTGGVRAGSASADNVEGAAKVCDEHDIEYELLTGNELNSRYPAYDVPEDYDAIYEPSGGYLACEEAIVTHVRQAQSNGAEVHARERALSWEPDGDSVRVRTDRETYTADHLIVASGAWAGKHIDMLSNKLMPERRVMGWIQPEVDEHFTEENFPVFSISSPVGNYYGFPVVERPGFKFGRSPEQPEIIDPNDWQNEPTLQDEELLRMLPNNFFPTGTGPTMGLTSCIVTRSIDDHFYIDTHPQYPQVSIGAGFSGTGFKFASAIGENLADLATNREQTTPVGLFDLENRF